MVSFYHGLDKSSVSRPSSVITDFCREEGCVVTEAWGESNRLLGHTPKSPDDSQISHVISFLDVLYPSGKWIYMCGERED